MPPVVTVIDGTGRPHDIPEDDLAYTLRTNPDWRVQSEAEGVSRATAEAEADLYSGAGNALDAAAARAWGAATVGGTDAALGVLGGDQAKHHLRKLKEHQGLASGAGEIIGGVTAAAAGFGPIGGAANLGARVAKGGGILRAGAGAGIEGAAQGLGSGISELALSEEPISVERATSTLGSRIIFGGVTGAAAGSLAKSAEIGLLKGKQLLDDVANRRAVAADVGDDLANLDIKGLQTVEKLEKEAIEASRVTQRSDLADELTAFRRELKQQKHAILTKDLKLAAEGDKLSTAEIGKLALKSNRQLDNMLDNPISLAKNPAKALDALQRQEFALSKVLERSDDLKAAYAADVTGARAAALETVAPALERNRALQAKIAAVSGEASSPRLQQIGQAKEALATSGRGSQTLAEQALTGAAFTVAAGAVASTDLPGAGFIAPLIGAKAAGMVGSKVFGRLGKAMGEGQARSARALAKVFDTGARATKLAPPLATRVLSQVAFAPERDDDPPAKTLPQLFKRRSQELRETVASGPDGKPVVKPHVRARIASTLQPIAAFQPLLADRMETLAVRRLEFLADKLPKRPEIAGLPIGPDNWQPSEMEMRAFARFVAAVEDPDGVLERVADGQVTSEDAEVMREVYPEQLQDFTFQVLGKLPELRQTLPYNRRLSLSVLTGVPVDPSMDPRILAALQSQFQAEPEPPTPKAQFGSVKNTEVGTPSQRREQGM